MMKNSMGSSSTVKEPISPPKNGVNQHDMAWHNMTWHDIPPCWVKDWCPRLETSMLGKRLMPKIGHATKKKLRSNTSEVLTVSLILQASTNRKYKSSSDNIIIRPQAATTTITITITILIKGVSHVDPGSSLTLILRRWSGPLDVDSGRCAVTLIRLVGLWYGILSAHGFHSYVKVPKDVMEIDRFKN